MKVTMMAVVLVLTSTAAFAKPYHVHAQAHRPHAAPLVVLHPNDGNPNGNPDGPTTLSGTGDSSFGGSSPGTSGYN